MQTERSIRGLFKFEEMQTRQFVWNLGVPDRCHKMKVAAKDALSTKEYQEFEMLCNAISKTADDRNMIVHGFVHAKLKVPEGTDRIVYYKPMEDIGQSEFDRIEYRAGRFIEAQEKERVIQFRPKQFR